MTKTIRLTLLVDKSRNRVVFAETSGDFVEVLLSFLALPLASILRLTSKPPLGSMRKLYECVENLSNECFRNEACKYMLLRPLNSAAGLFRALPIDYDNNNHQICFGYVCEHHCLTLSLYANAICSCGTLTKTQIPIARKEASSNDKTCMISQNSKFIVTDDLLVFQHSASVSFELLANLSIKQSCSLESMSVDVTPEKIVELLERLLISVTPITDVFLGKHSEGKQPIMKQNYYEKCNVLSGPAEKEKISIRLYLNQGDNKVAFAEAGKEFVDLIMSFLTYPMTYLLNKFEGLSGIHCVDNLYKSIETLELANCFSNNEMIDILHKPKIPPFFSLKNKVIDFDEQVMNEKFYKCGKCNKMEQRSSAPTELCIGCSRRVIPTQIIIINPKIMTNDDSSGDYMWNSRHIITDDLTVKPLSAVMVVFEYPGLVKNGIKSMIVEIGEHEALALLRASISSDKVFTDIFLAKENEKPRVRSY